MLLIWLKICWIFFSFSRGNLVVKRQSLLPRFYSVTDAAARLRKPFKPPCLVGYNNNNEQLVRRLWARKRFVPWGSTRPALVAITNRVRAYEAAAKDEVEENVDLPPGVEALVLWEADESDCNSAAIEVDPLLVKFLRPHQRYFVNKTACIQFCFNVHMITTMFWRISGST